MMTCSRHKTTLKSLISQFYYFSFSREKILIFDRSSFLFINISLQQYGKKHKEAEVQAYVPMSGC